MTLPAVPSFDEADTSDKPSFMRKFLRLRPAAHARLRARYRQRVLAVQALDDMVAQLVRWLEQRGAWANTYLLFTSDNGYHAPVAAATG